MPAVIVEKDAHVLTVTLNRPEKRNAVNCQVMCLLYDAWRELDADTEDFDVATSRMWEDYSQVRYYARGATILDPAGERVGVYFSSIRFVSIHFKPNNRVQLVLDTSVVRGGPDDRKAP